MVTDAVLEVVTACVTTATEHTVGSTQRTISVYMMPFALNNHSYTCSFVIIS